MLTRFAPSPTGDLHLGHAYSAVLAHEAARAAGGTFLIRIDDIDGIRSREEYVGASLADLAWLGLGWDSEPVRQSARLSNYAAALDTLRARGLVYPCFCTRADIAASLSAPHGPSGAVYPGTCRDVPAAERDRRMAAEPHCLRLDTTRAVANVGAADLGRARAGVAPRRPARPRRHRPRAQGCPRQLSSRQHARRCRDGGHACHPRRRPHRRDRRPPTAPGAARPANPRFTATIRSSAAPTANGLPSVTLPRRWHHCAPRVWMATRSPRICSPPILLSGRLPTGYSLQMP